MSVFNEYYKIAGKIDIFDIKTEELIERKTQIFLDENKKPKIYLGYRYQLWGQMFCLQEMGYNVSKLWIYSVKDNKKYRIYKPSSKQLLDFERFLKKYREFNLNQKHFKQNSKKCLKCIYKELCDYYI
jgi:CRISPR-associated protein Cas4